MIVHKPGKQVSTLKAYAIMRLSSFAYRITTQDWENLSALQVQNPRRESMAGAQSGTDQAQIDMKKIMKEIRGMFSELKNEVTGINEKFSDIISELRTDISEIRTDVAEVNKKVQDIERQVGEMDKS